MFWVAPLASMIWSHNFSTDSIRTTFRNDYRNSRPADADKAGAPEYRSNRGWHGRHDRTANGWMASACRE